VQCPMSKDKVRPSSLEHVAMRPADRNLPYLIVKHQEIVKHQDFVPLGFLVARLKLFAPLECYRGAKTILSSVGRPLVGEGFFVRKDTPR
jgi:hypothetical protein